MTGGVIICGAPRAGSTALFRYLSMHPSIAGARNKELNYFLGGGLPYEDIYSSSDVSRENYLGFFGGLNEARLTLEASPAYMHGWCSVSVASRIKALLPDAKLIFILRDPVARLLSQYIADTTRSDGIGRRITFNEYVEACLAQDRYGVFGKIPEEQRKLYLEGLSIGKYSEVISSYLSCFCAARVYIIFSENLIQDASREMMSLAEFLGIDASFYKGMKFEKENKSIAPRNKLIYQMSLKLNSSLEPLLNKFPWLRSLLRRIHDYFNSGKNESNLDLAESNKQVLQAYYHDSHVALFEIVKRVNSSGVLPEWLARMKG